MPRAVYPLTPPSTSYARVQFGNTNNNAIVRNPFTAQHQIQERDYSQWSATVSLPPMRVDEAREWIVFLMRLKGRAGTFYFGDRSIPNNVSLPGTTRVAATAGSYDIQANIPPTATGSLVSGQFIQINTGILSRLHMVASASTPNAAGNLTITLEPPLKADVPANTSLIFDNPKGVFRMATNRTEWSIDVFENFGLNFVCEEA